MRPLDGRPVSHHRPERHHLRIRHQTPAELAVQGAFELRMGFEMTLVAVATCEPAPDPR